MNQRLDSTALWVEPNTAGKTEASKQEKRKEERKMTEKIENKETIPSDILLYS